MIERLCRRCGQTFRARRTRQHLCHGAACDRAINAAHQRAKYHRDHPGAERRLQPYRTPWVGLALQAIAALDR